MRLERRNEHVVVLSLIKTESTKVFVVGPENQMIKTAEGHLRGKGGEVLVVKNAT